MSAIRRSHAEVDMDIALGVLGEFVMGDDQAEEMLSRVQAGVDDGRQQLQGAVEALQGIRAVLEARGTDPDAAGVAYDATGHALAALNALGRQ